MLDTLLLLASADSAWLIATSDAWFEFVAGHRAALDSAFGRILHPQNTALETCTQKAAFSEFCLRNALPILRASIRPALNAATPICRGLC